MSLNSMYYGPGALEDRSANVVVTNPPADVKGRQIVAAVIDQSLPGTSNAVVAQGVYNTSPPTLTAGQRSELQVDGNGNLRARLIGASGAGVDTNSNTLAYAVAPTSANVAALLGIASHNYDGATGQWPRSRGDSVATFNKAPPLAGTDRSIVATTTSQPLMAANPTRSKFIIQNDSLIDVWINFGATAAATPGGGNYRIKADTNREFTGTSGAVNIIATSTTAAISAREF